jgi:prepilin-type processing-associated H-X9-DG protein
VERLSRPTAGGPFHIELGGASAGTLEADEIIANVGFRPNSQLYEELQVPECCATQSTMKLAESLVHPEPNFYILGAKSYGRKSNFLFADGLTQIREVFTIIGDRTTLDLYASAHDLLR